MNSAHLAGSRGGLLLACKGRNCGGDTHPLPPRVRPHPLPAVDGIFEFHAVSIPKGALASNCVREFNRVCADSDQFDQ